MKKILLISSVMAVTAGTIFAQNSAAPQAANSAAKTAPKPAMQKSPQVSAKEKVTEMMGVCGLQDEQVGPITKLYVEYYYGVSTLQSQKSTLSAEKYNEKMIALKVQRNEGIKSILTADQRRMLLQANYDKDSAPVKAKAEK